MTWTSWSESNNGLPAYSITALASIGSNSFAGTYSSGIFLSTNNGSSWTEVNTGLTDYYVNAIAIDGTNIFAGTDSGVFLSTNNGSNWTGVNTGITDLYVWDLTIDGTNIFAGTYGGGGVFLSTNNGANWTAVNNGLTELYTNTLTSSDGTIFVGTDNGVFLSTNNGSNWTGVNTGITDLDIHALTISGTNVFAGTESGAFLSTNNGSSWTEVNTGLTDLIIWSLESNNNNIFAGTENGGVFLSTNNGSSWSEFNTGLTNLDIGSLGFSGDNFFVGTIGSGVFLSTLNLARYYVSHLSSIWDSTNNWSESSGGPIGASVPGSNNTAYFDGSGQGRCILDTSVSIYALNLNTSYKRTVEQNNYPIEISNGANFNGGTFSGGTADIYIDGTAYFGNSRFISTESELLIKDYFCFNQPPPDSSRIVIVMEDHITILSEDITRRYAILSQTPDNTSTVVLNIEGGSSQEYGVDYYTEENLVKWDGKVLESELILGSTLRVIYTVLQDPGFFHNRGTVVMNSSKSTLYGSGVDFYNLNFRQDGTENLYCLIDSSAYVENLMTLEDGNIKKGTDSTLSIYGDIDNQPLFGSRDPRNTSYILVEGNGYQTITTGGILPTLTVNKNNTTNQLVLLGTDPLYVSGDLIVSDGTFNTNGLDIKVGTL